MVDLPKENENTTNNASNITFQRRRRKRNRPQQSGRANGKEKYPDRGGITSKSLRIDDDFCADDQNRFAFLDKDGDDLADQKPRFRSLSILLEERRSGMFRGRQKKFQTDMLFNFTKKPAKKHIGRRQWRPYANRKIPFTKLGSPPTDAVLAMQRTADYVLTLGTMGYDTPGLALRFYGVNSPAAFIRQQSGKINSTLAKNALKAPLLQTTPLLCVTSASPELFDRVDNPFHAPTDVSPSTTLVELIVSKDWKVGLALLDPPKETPYPSTSSDASMILFTLPQRSAVASEMSDNGVNVIFEFHKVPFTNDHTRRKMLWSVESIPDRTKNNSYDTYYSAPGYLLVNNEKKSVRLYWATEKAFLKPSCLLDVSVDSRFVNGTTGSEILEHSPRPSWTKVCRNKMDGTTIYGHGDTDSLSTQVSIVNECVVHIDILLSTILSRRKGFSDMKPEFHYSLVSVNSGGRIADFVVVFPRPKKRRWLGFYVRIDLFTGTFVELDWVQCKERQNMVHLRLWCEELALNRRMSDLRAGPFCVTGKHHSQDWTNVSFETWHFDNDEDDDYDESYWRDFVLEYQEGKFQAPKAVTFSSLYPCCDVIWNHPIIALEPVMSIRAKDSPIQLVYN